MSDSEIPGPALEYSMPMRESPLPLLQGLA
jgi:hypothetical protein